MNEQPPFCPDWASPPGDTISDVLKELDISLERFATQLGIPVSQAEMLLSGELTLTNKIAMALAEVLGSTPGFWMTREVQYQESKNFIEGRERDNEYKNWVRTLPISEMVKFGWISLSGLKVGDKAYPLLSYFNVPSVNAWIETYENLNREVAFRTSATFNEQIGAIAAWIRQGEIEAEKISCRDWQKESFQNALADIRKLTRKKEPREFLPSLVDICANCGVAVIVVRAPKGCRASGATKFLSPNKALLQLSFRYLSDDHFWFTFFHEAAHLILHDKKFAFLEEERVSSNKEESEADAFAGKVLIPEYYQAALHSLGADAKKVMRFARDIGISPGIVVGQMQHIGLIPPHYLNKLKTRLRWG
ncbi:MAG: hypothetical protein JWQ21_628 [Herminiimonas sp.]|nr:hypothetical protein [Herminiimonas sp.]